MKKYNNLFKRNGIEVNKYTIIGKSTIVDTNKGKFVIKKIDNSNLFNYLYSREFKNFPKIIDYDNEYTLFEYIDDIKYEKEEKLLDTMKYLACLHYKTSYYKEINQDESKRVFEDVINKIDYIYNYYVDIINNIESKIYMSPSENLLARNISNIFEMINYSRNNISIWYEKVKENNKKRVSTLHNNLDLSNVLKNKELYFISWDNSKIDSPIYDLIDIYFKECEHYSFNILLLEYEKYFPLLDEEKLLLYSLISIPNKITFTNDEYFNVKEVKLLIDKILKLKQELTFKKEENTTNNE